MIVAGIDAHATYLVVAIVSNDGGLIQKPLRIRGFLLTVAGREIDAVALLRTVPGIGPYRGLLIATETQPIARFGHRSIW